MKITRKKFNNFYMYKTLTDDGEETGYFQSFSDKVMYYLTTKKYMGSCANLPEFKHNRWARILTSPLTDFSGDSVINGYFGEDCGYVYEAHGEFETLEQARAAMNKKFGKLKKDISMGGEVYFLETPPKTPKIKPVKKRTMYYVIERKHQWIDQYNIDSHTISICTSALTDKEGAPVIQGHRSYNDENYTAHGEYKTLKQARAAIAKKFGIVRNCDENGEKFDGNDDDTIEVYKTGKYIPMNSYDSSNFVNNLYTDEIEENTSDEQIYAIFDEYESAANENGSTLFKQSIIDEMFNYRDSLQDSDEE